jgi:hypothetical protein
LPSADRAVGGAAQERRQRPPCESNNRGVKGYGLAGPLVDGQLARVTAPYIGDNSTRTSVGSPAEWSWNSRPREPSPNAYGRVIRGSPASTRPRGWPPPRRRRNPVALRRQWRCCCRQPALPRDGVRRRFARPRAGCPDRLRPGPCRRRGHGGQPRLPRYGAELRGTGSEVLCGDDRGGRGVRRRRRTRPRPRARARRLHPAAGCRPCRNPQARLAIGAPQLAVLRTLARAGARCRVGTARAPARRCGTAGWPGANRHRDRP